MKKTRNAIKMIDRMVGDDLELREMIAEESVNAAVARLIFDARTEAGYSQKQLADLIGTKQPVIARLEDADYEGHSLSMLIRIARALKRPLRIGLDELPRHRPISSRKVKTTGNTPTRRQKPNSKAGR